MRTALLASLLTWAVIILYGKAALLFVGSVCYATLCL